VRGTCRTLLYAAIIAKIGRAGVDLYLDRQNIDTIPRWGAFTEFERTMIRQRVRAGLKKH
jgi:hypothetical protein